MNRLVFLLTLSFLCFPGCSCSNAQIPFLGKSEKRKLEEAQAKEDLNRLNAAKMQEADALVQKWADEVSKTQKRHEGLTDLDPWGNQVTIAYHQEWAKEVATIRSNGPDGKPKTPDDLVRIRSYDNPSEFMSGISGFGWFVIVWIGSGLLAYMFSTGVARRRRSKGLPAKHVHPVGFALAVIVLAPLTALIYMLQFLGSALGATGEFWDGFDFDFGGIDLDLG
jgi:hypothetical protein